MRIKKSKLLVTFETLIEELESRNLRDMEVCAIHTRLNGQPAYVLSVPKQGLFSILAHEPSIPKHVRLITLRLPDPGKDEAEARIHHVRETDIENLAFITTHFFYEYQQSTLVDDLYGAFPGYNKLTRMPRAEPHLMDLAGFMS